ncbi:MAG: YdcF family protein [Acutalibacteraceae bacterium]|nr:YdcF family protein [Acutalibacteraceae bacterium]
MIKRKSIILISVIAIISAILIGFLSTAVSIWEYGEMEEKQTADVAIVLGAALSKNSVSPVYRERINHAITLYNEGYVKYVILTGGVGEGNIYSDAFIAMEYAVSVGLPKKAILLEEKSTVTKENLLYSKEIMEDNLLKTAIIVSDPIHMKRAMLMANDMGMIAFASPTSTTMYQTTKTQIPFLIRELFLYISYGFERIFK